MIGYILLISIAMVISGGVYIWLKTYVPQEKIECPEGISIGVTKISCSLASKEVEITIRNNGRFNYNGYIIYANNNSDKNFPATIDFAKEIREGGSLSSTSGIQIPDGPFMPGESSTAKFSIAKSGSINAIELTPFRLDSDNNRKKLLICNEAKIRESVSCN